MTTNPVAIITGANRGIGKATAIDLGRRGYRLALAARTAGPLEEVAAATNALAIPTDVTKPTDVDNLIEQTLQKFGRIDALVHCAGLAPAVSAAQTSIEQWRAVLDTNLSAAFYLARAAWPVFEKQRGGVIVNISSQASRDPFPGFAAYAAAKAGLNMLSLVLAREGASIGVRVHAIAPGAVETEMLRALFPPEKWPAEKTLSPAEVASVIAQCVTGELRYTSGEVIFLARTF